ncbi:ADP-ribose glycohydrolase OARD1-like [Macrosteles quadrilineatus]|uniref:ADP-ribose glycohydrolase OARD1-like n=1 Tax=Macrosteles quadrilineatus TaxID=74068 RepID=UPI0023E2FF31|nr:ADP-ribose glycohydrolase OARD1-like [Macrosteles quadrilineatus]
MTKKLNNLLGDHGQREEQQVRNLSTEPKDVVPERRRNEEPRPLYKDLFTLPVEYALAHCVAEDLRASRGIATVFRKKFGGTEYLERQSPTIGTTLAVALHLKRNGQHLFYLVTKETSSKKHSYESMKKSLQDLRDKLLRIGIKKLAIPRLGCGYDGLEWRIVRNMVQDLFKDTGIEIVVCVYNPWGTSGGPEDRKLQGKSVLG